LKPLHTIKENEFLVVAEVLTHSDSPDCRSDLYSSDVERRPALRRHTIAESRQSSQEIFLGRSNHKKKV
jgi:hypothetical protein